MASDPWPALANVFGLGASHHSCTGTRPFTDHDGFDLGDPCQAASRRILGAGWPARPGNLSAVLDEEG
jgi:hypothetical protein